MRLCGIQEEKLAKALEKMDAMPEVLLTARMALGRALQGSVRVTIRML